MNDFRTATFLAAALAFLTAADTEARAAAPAGRKVLLIGIDGCRPDALEAAATPHLDRLIRAGAFSTNTSILGPRQTGSDTVSGPGWSSIFTGVWADKHGVTDNTFEGKNYERYPHLFSLLKKSKPAAVTASFCDWKPIQEHIVSDATVSESPVQEPKEADGWRTADDALAEAAANYLRDQNPDAACVYFGHVDETGHAKGFHPSVPDYVAAIERVDGYVGRLLAAIEKRSSFEREEWLVIVTTDHGGQGIRHGGGHELEVIRRVFLIVSGPGVKDPGSQRQTYIVDAVPTALSWLGVALEPEWELDGSPFGVADEIAEEQ